MTDPSPMTTPAGGPAAGGEAAPGRHPTNPETTTMPPRACPDCGQPVPSHQLRHPACYRASTGKAVS